ncbi:MAG: hypothetical protein NWE92_03020 [Candidatus Bathyarchaeota archaeon]|nr:hypothetical protein [Candidatus Bathyarchaeota archaeon]
MSRKEKSQEFIVPCCPQLDSFPACDVLQYQYRLLHPVTVGAVAARQTVNVEVVITARLERCPGPLALGDLVYSTTLLPGEKVRLFTSDRRSRFTYDSETKLNYRTEQTSEEQYYMTSMDEFMSDLTIRDSANSTNTTKGHYDTHSNASGILETIFTSPSVNAKGNFDGESTSEFMRELTQHAQAAHNRSENATRTAGSKTIGEVETRSHQEGESQDHLEASSREFSNPNKCHAVTYYFYQINKTQTVKFSFVSIEKRVIDPAGDTKVTNNAFGSKGSIATLATAVLATSPKRLELENMARQSEAAEKNTQTITATATVSARTSTVASQQPISLTMRRQAVAAVNAQLAEAGLVNVDGNLSTKTKEFSFEVRSSLPTPGLLVKGCLDSCDVCDETRKREIELDLEHKRLENELLKRKIELLDKAQEYRCCPQPAPEPEA